MSVSELTEKVNELRAEGTQVIEQNLSLDYLSRGLLVKVSVHGAGIFDRKLRFEELGIKTDDQMSDWIKPGQKSYAPGFSGQLHSWGTRCRQLVSRYTLSLNSVETLTASTSWKFLLFDAYDSFKAGWEELQQVRNEIVEQIERSYPYLIDEAVDFYVEQAERSWNLLQSRYGYGTAIILPSGVTFGPDERQGYLNWVEANVRADFPTMETVHNEVYAEYWVNVMFDTSSLAQEEAERQEADAKAAAARLAQAQAEDQRWELSLSRQAREEAIRQAELERMRARLAETVDPFAEAMDQLLKELAGHITALTEGVEKHGNFRGRSLSRVGQMAELFKVMGGKYLDNDTLTRTLDDLKGRAVEQPSEETRDAWTSQIINGLTTLRREVTSEAEIIERRMQAHTRAGALEL